MKFIFSILFFVLASLAYGQVIYQHDFGTTTITAHPYTVAPVTLNSNLTTSGWSNSNSAWTSNTGNSGQAISLASTAGLPTITLNLSVASGYQLSVSSFDMWLRKAGNGPSNWSMTINGIAVGAGTLTSNGAVIGVTPVSNAVNGLTGNISVVISLSGGNGGDMRLDDFILNGAVAPLLPSIKANNCGTTVASAISFFHANPYPGAQEYEFRSYNGVTYHAFNSGLADSARFFDFGTGNYMYNTTYSIDVRVKVAGVWTSFGPSCNVSTPIAPLTALTPSQCGTTLLMNQYFSGQHVFGANGYRFRVSDGITTQIFDTTVYWININHFTLLPSTSYTIDIAPGINGTFYSYGSACSITSPNTPTSRLSPAQCGTTLVGVNQNLIGTHTSGATNYRFRLYDGLTYQTYNSPNYWTSINNFTTAFATNYLVDVAPTVGGVVYPYGIACQITTMTAPTSRLSPSQCGSTLVTMTQNLIGTHTSGATNYRFRIYDGVTYQTYDSPNYWTSISNFTTSFATTYTVDIAPTIGGTLYPYGTTCSITTMNAPSTQVIASQCGTTLGYMSSNIIASHVSGATSYRFRITDGINTLTYDTPNYWASFNNLGANVGTTYTVDIAAMVAGTMFPYGTSCNVTSPGEALTIASNKNEKNIYDKSLEQQTQNFTFETIAYPNPFINIINLEITSDDSVSPVSIKVFDAAGRIIESREVNLNNETTVGIGMDCAIGIYQVQILQKERISNIRVIKN